MSCPGDAWRGVAEADTRWPGRQRASENRAMEHLSRQRLEAGLGQENEWPVRGLGALLAPGAAAASGDWPAAPFPPSACSVGGWPRQF